MTISRHPIPFAAVAAALLVGGAAAATQLDSPLAAAGYFVLAPGLIFSQLLPGETSAEWLVGVGVAWFVWASIALGYLTFGSRPAGTPEAQEGQDGISN